MRLQELTSAQALRSIVELEPAEGPGGRIFPPTYPLEDGTKGRQKFRHAVEEVGDGRKRVLIDSAASQANRQEAALVEARRAGLISRPAMSAMCRTPWGITSRIPARRRCAFWRCSGAAITPMCHWTRGWP